MNKAQKFLLENNLDDIVLNAKQYPENTTVNAEKWIYLSDVLEQYLAINQALRIHDVSKSFTAGEIVDELEDSDTLDDAIMFFKEQM